MNTSTYCEDVLAHGLGAIEYPPELTNAAVACLHAGEQVDAQRGVLVVSRQLLLDLPGIACVGAGTVVGQRFRAGELVVAAGCGDDVTV